LRIRGPLEQRCVYPHDPFDLKLTRLRSRLEASTSYFLMNLFIQKWTTSAFAEIPKTLINNHASLVRLVVQRLRSRLIWVKPVRAREAIASA
jgi:hypothetical protein